MSETQERPITLGLEDRPLVRDVIVICKQLIREERWHRRLARSIGRLRRMDWTAWWFRMRMRWHRWANKDATATLQREIDRVHTLTTRMNQELRESGALAKGASPVRGKVLLPRGIFVVQPKVPDDVDIVWPRRTS